MENQHRQIKGYRELSQAEIDLMNRIKTQGVAMGDLIADLRNYRDPHNNEELPPPSLDQRWISIGTTHLQEGLMALTRAVARPTFF